MSIETRKLGQLKKGQQGIILNITGPSISDGAEGPLGDLPQRLMEMGFLEGSQVEIVHEAPFGKDPIAIRVRGALIALRRNEANLILVQEISPKV